MNTEEEINRAILKISIPAGLGFFFHTMFNVVDTYFAGLLNTAALAGLSSSFPIFFLIIAFSNGLGTGVNSMISNFLGSGQTEKAKQVLIQGILMGAIVTILITIIGIKICPFLIDLQSSAEYRKYALEYLEIMFMGSGAFIFFSIFNSTLTALGDSKKFRNALFVGMFLNIILNPIFMFVLNFGFAGIAWATITIELFQTAYLAAHLNRLGFLKLSPNQIKVDWGLIGKLLFHGSLAAMNMITIGVGIFVITFFVSQVGTEAVAAYGIGIRIEQIVLLPAIAIGVATQSLAGRFNGAREFQSLEILAKQSIKIAGLISLVGLLIIFLGKSVLIAAFSNNLAVQRIAGDYLIYASILLFIYSIIFISNSFFFALQHSWWPVIFGLFRQILIPLVLIPIGIQLGNATGIWLAITCNNILMSVVIALTARYCILKVSQPTKH